MSEFKKLLHGSLILTTGHVSSYALSFARNVILARLLTKADFGLAALFGMTLSLLEVAGRMSFGQQIIQSKEGDSRPFMATSHTFQFLLSVVGAILMVVMSHPLACAFKVPQLTWAFAMLAIVPFARGFEQLDYYRQQRELNYLPGALRELVPQIVVTLAAWPLAVYLRDFRVIVWLMLGKAVLGIVMTHWLSTRPYRWAWRQNYVRSMWLFGWPLLLNGLLMFASQQADQVVVGALLSLNELAAYALALSLVSIPLFIFGQVAYSILLPILSKAQDDEERFRRQYRSCVEYAAVGAVALILPMVVVGEQLVVLLFGEKYHGSGIIMALLGAASAIRFLRFVPAVAAMARADTANQLYSNLWRSLGLLLSITVGLLGGRVTMIAGCAVVGELVAAVVSLLRLRRKQGVPLRDTASSVGYVIGFLTLGLGLVYLGTPRLGHGLAAGTLIVVIGMSLLVSWFVFPRVIQTVWVAIKGARRHGDKADAPV